MSVQVWTQIPTMRESTVWFIAAVHALLSLCCIQHAFDNWLQTTARSMRGISNDMWKGMAGSQGASAGAGTTSSTSYTTSRTVSLQLMLHANQDANRLNKAHAGMQALPVATTLPKYVHCWANTFHLTGMWALKENLHVTIGRRVTACFLPSIKEHSRW